MLECDIGVMAHNEEKNIGHLLQALISQKNQKVKIDHIFVVASGCTDNTVQIVQDYAKRENKIKLIVQRKREGKASAINLFLKKTQSPILVLESADTLPEKNAIEKLIKPFSDPQVGMTGAHMRPVDDPSTFWGFAAHFQWHLHHLISLRSPKMGELVAFRKIFVQIPKFSSVDEANIEPLIKGQGFRLKYIPLAIVYNKGPENLADFLKQRRRIFAGHLALKKDQGYSVATMSGLRIFLLYLKNFQFNFQYIFWAPLVILFEIYGRLLGFYDFHFKKRSHAIWERSETTKKLVNSKFKM